MQEYTVLVLLYQQMHYNLYDWNTVLFQLLHQSHPVFCQSGHTQIPSSINSHTGQLGYIRCWSNGTRTRKPHPSMLLYSFDNGSFIIPILRDGALS